MLVALSSLRRTPGRTSFNAPPFLSLPWVYCWMLPGCRQEECTVIYKRGKTDKTFIKSNNTHSCTAYQNHPKKCSLASLLTPPWLFLSLHSRAPFPRLPPPSTEVRATRDLSSVVSLCRTPRPLRSSHSWVFLTSPSATSPLKSALPAALSPSSVWEPASV